MMPFPAVTCLSIFYISCLRNLFRFTTFEILMIFQILSPIHVNDCIVFEWALIFCMFVFFSVTISLLNYFKESNIKLYTTGNDNKPLLKLALYRNWIYFMDFMRGIYREWNLYELLSWTSKCITVADRTSRYLRE